MALVLEILTNRDSPEPRNAAGNIYAKNADHIIAKNENQRMIPRKRVVGVVLNISFTLPAILKQHLAPDPMKRSPLFCVPRCS